MLDKRTSGDTEGAGICGDSLGAISNLNFVKAHPTKESSRTNLVPPVSLLVGFPDYGVTGLLPLSSSLRPFRPCPARRRSAPAATSPHAGRSDGARRWRPPGRLKRAPEAGDLPPTNMEVHKAPCQKESRLLPATGFCALPC